MNQQLSALLGAPTAAATAVTPNPGVESMALTDTPPTFANTLKDALSDLVTPDAATQALSADFSAVLLTAAPVPAATDAALALAVGSNTPADGGNSSPEIGNDLPLMLQLLDAASTPSAVLGATTGDAGLLQPDATQALPDAGPASSAASVKLSQPDATQSLPDASLALAAAVAQAGTPMAANVPGVASTTSPATARTATPVIAQNALNARPDAAVLMNPSALAVHGDGARDGQAQTASQDQHAQQRHTPPDLDLLTSIASVLVPVKERSTEGFGLPVSASLPTSVSDTAIVTSAAPVAVAGIASSNVASPSVTGVGSSALPIPQAPGQPGWGDVFADRVTFAVKQNLQEAEIRLNPPQLGQVDVRIVMNNDQANLMFSSPHGAVRDAIEASVGRLRDMLADSGFNLVNVDVSDKSLAQQRGDAREQRESGRGGSQTGYRADFELAEHAPEVLRSTRSGSIDYYA